MNKSLITNIVAAICVALGYLTGHSIVFTIGIFALSGAITNLLAIHMLFEKVPLLYGSGVITLKFKEFKQSIRRLILEEFFDKEKVSNVLQNQQDNIDLEPVIKKVDLDPAFDTLITVIESSQFGPMLTMFGGSEALQPMRSTFVEKMKETLVEITEEPQFKSLLVTELLGGNSTSVHDTIEQAVDERLDELTPTMVKDIIQNMIKTHLGWLVVWGGVFGGLFGLVAAIINIS
ncbi:DUF445 domain-containing protein [Pseudoalteromonas sp. MMG013]|uniref:DUF445 domain-containing protein n=1 Tax=Pseudoalteromonas sp. MMG013 TaxID=2822687 RepID=UPI001B396E7B|nr:DUF445 domain-containing protein [Pseudoalteromonas sp. MMG013]MBQ4864688.1 DUF445 domain-containing protein [Pseudoalteromonas sp. MMG013]